MRLILASASTRRAELLRAAGFEFEIVAADIDESLRDGETPAAYVRRLAAEKSAAVMRALCEGDPVVVGADTTVVIDGEILGKPADDDDATRMLRQLAGRTHEVLTGISVRCGTQETGRVESTRVTFAALSEAEVAWYITSGDWRDKAGGYGIQGLASRFVTRLDGSYPNVVGLPIATLVELLSTYLASGGEAGYPDASHSRKSL